MCETRAYRVHTYMYTQIEAERDRCTERQGSLSDILT